MARKKNTTTKKDLKLITEIDLNMRQEKFCQLFATSADFFGNGVSAYLEVYDIDKSKPNWYKTACSAASQLLSNIKVVARINEILEETGFNDVAVDKQHSFLIAQHEDKNVKLGAIKEYNKLKKRTTEVIEMKRPLEDMTDEELAAVQREARNLLIKK